MLEVAGAYTTRTGTGVALNTAGSNVLAQQIEAGAPADVFVSADARWIDELIAGGSLDPASRRELLSNRLVVIAHSGAGYSLESLSLIGALPFRYLSIADPDSVPAGRYARSLLEHTPRPSGTAWDEVAARVAPAPDVRAALAVVAAEPDAIGIVYRSDVMGAASGGGAGPTAATSVEPRRRGAARDRARARSADPLRRRAGAPPAGARAGVGRAPRLPRRRRGERHLRAPRIPAAAAATVGMSNDVVAALELSLLVASVSIAVIGPPAIALGYVMARRAFPGRDLLAALLGLPLVLPPTAIGLLLLRLFGARGPLGRETLGIDLGFLLTWRGAVAACSVMALPLVVRTARVTFEGVDPRFEAMARTLGHGAVATFARFTLPLAARGLVAAAILGFTRAVGEFGATVMVAGNIPGRTRTLASGIYAAQQARARP